MRKLVADAKLADVLVSSGKLDASYDGRYEFSVRLGKRSVLVHMPGLRLDKVRWIDRKDQNIWHFPRLYVAGNSWVWLYAVGAVRRELTGRTDKAEAVIETIERELRAP